jgi:hypothetical protein
MRDSNYSFPAQNRVCVSITAQLYDRRGKHALVAHERKFPCARADLYSRRLLV